MTDTKAQTGESTGQTSHSLYRIPPELFRTQFQWMTLTFMMMAALDMFLSWFAVDNGFYETNPFTNWLAQYVGIDISLAIHCAILVIIGIVVMYLLDYLLDEKQYHAFMLLGLFMSLLAGMWAGNNILSIALLLS